MTPSTRMRRTATPLSSLCAAGAVLAALVLSAGAARPATAEAWAWKDTCVAVTSNASGSQSAVRPVFYVPVLPSAAGEATYTAFAIVGLPTTGKIPFSNTGYPAPSYGCHAVLQFVNPGDNVSCAYSAPTTGANHFTCGGNAKVVIVEDDDDIVGEVTIAQKRLADEPAAGDDPDGDGTTFGPPTPDPAFAPPALRPGELPGDGWIDSEDVGDLGRAGDLMRAGDLPDGCAGDDAAAGPQAVRSTLLTTAGGDVGVGAVSQRYASDAAAGAATADVVSDASIRCLAGLLRSGDERSDVAVADVPGRLLGDAGDGVDGARLTITRGRAVDVLDVLAWSDGADARVLLLAGDGGPIAPAVARAALRRAG